MSGELGPPWICASCRRVLDVHTTTAGVSLAHTTQDARTADHEPIPVRDPNRTLGRYRCDFCNVELVSVVWLLPVRDFNMTMGDTPYESVDDWACCDTCADLVGSNQWTRLVNRAVATRGEADRPIIARIYRELRKRVAGPPRRAG